MKKYQVQSALKKLKGKKMLVREASQTQDAVKNGGGYLYSIHPQGSKFPTRSGRYLIENGLVKGRGDGLVDARFFSQTFELSGKREKQ